MFNNIYFAEKKMRLIFAYQLTTKQQHNEQRKFKIICKLEKPIFNNVEQYT
jgi:hypothetical protein